MIELLAIGFAIGIGIAVAVDLWTEAQRRPRDKVWGEELNHGIDPLARYNYPDLIEKKEA